MAAAKDADKLRKDIETYSSMIYKTNPNDPGYQRLPKCWNTKDRSKSLKLSHFSLTVSFVGGCNDRHDSAANHDPGCVRTDVPIPLNTGIYYFEITISAKGSNGWSLSVGVQQKGSSLSKHTGMEHTSFGLHSDGSLYHWSASSAIKFGPRSVENDTLGCGVDFISRCLFFTRNGIFLGKAFEGKIPTNPGARLYPAVGLQGRGARITTNFGQRPFCYAFDLHIKRERLAQENHLVERMCKEEFAGPKMKELVSGYLVHHGYVATARSFSRWTLIPITNTSSQADSVGPQLPSTTQSPVHSSSAPCLVTTYSVSCGSGTDSSHTSDRPESAHLQNSGSLPRRHSDGFFTNVNTITSQLPGFSTMIYRRRLRALCRRNQYGRAAATLHRLYPQVLERCPELLVQLRCRQMIEMMRRHALRRGRVASPEHNTQTGPSHSSIVPAKVQRLSESQHVRSACCLTEKISTPRHQFEAQMAQSHVNGSSVGSMEVDSDTPRRSSPTDGIGLLDTAHSSLGDGDDDASSIGENDDNDDDDFGMDEDTGIVVDPSAHTSLHNNHMEVDGELPSTEPQGSLRDDDRDEMPCLLRHVQFGRSLVNLVRQVRAKTGGLSFETEKLLQQSVSLLAYSSPTSSECPLRGLLDPSWCDTVANIVNSAVLKAHDLPVQPALEQGLLSLQRCLKDPQFVEGQTLGHFLFYHLTPSQLVKIEQGGSQETSVANSHRDGSREGNEGFEISNGSASGSDQKPVLNGHTSARRRRRCGIPPSETGQVSQGTADVEECGSSLEDVFAKDDDSEEAEEDVQEEEAEEDAEESTRTDTCRPDEDSTNEDDDDDEQDTDRALDIRRRTRDNTLGYSHSDTPVPPERDPSSVTQVGGRTQAGGYRVRQFSTLRSSFTHNSPNSVRPSQTVFARCVPTLILEPSRTRVVAAIPSVLPSTRHLVNRTISVDAPLIPVAHVTGTRHTESEIPPNQYLDSSFNGLLSLSYPQHAEFLTAMNDALKAYAGSLLVTDGESSGPSSSISLNSRHRRDESPPDTGADGDFDDCGTGSLGNAYVS